MVSTQGETAPCLEASTRGDKATGVGPGRGPAPSLRLVWAVFFTYAGMVGVLVQTVLLPHLLPAWHQGHGLLRGTDAPVFHRRAVKEAEEIRRAGWSSWRLRPGSDLPVAITSAVYSVSVDEPWTMIPINAAVHATGGLVLLCIVAEFVRRRRHAVWAAIPCIAYPSAMTWYAQLHRDGWAILGTFLIVFGWLVLARSRTQRSLGRLGGGAWILLGAALVWVARPYLLQAFLVFGVAIALLLSGAWLMRGCRGRAPWRDVAVVSVLSWAVVGVLGWGAVKGLAAGSGGEGGALEGAGAGIQPGDEFDWQKSRWLPEPVDRRFRSVAKERAALLRIYPDAGSNVDIEVGFHSARAVLAYAPRALTVALFAPFPRDWLPPGVTPGGTLMRRVAGAEMLGVYLAVAFVPYGAWRWRARVETYVLLLFGTGMLVVYGTVIANVGTLYRLRYGYIMLLVGLGVGAAMEAWEDRRTAR